MRSSSTDNRSEAVRVGVYGETPTVSAACMSISDNECTKVSISYVNAPRIEINLSRVWYGVQAYIEIVMSERRLFGHGT